MKIENKKERMNEEVQKNRMRNEKKILKKKRKI